MSEPRQGEPQYQSAIELMQRLGLQRMGYMTSWGYYDDPKRLAFTFARYKFVAKMFEGAESVLEAGCGDVFAARIVAQAVRKLTAVDFDPDFIASAKDTLSPRWPIDCRVHNMLVGPVEGTFDAAYSLDVLEHIPAEQEDCFLTNMIAPLTEHGMIIIGMPSIQSQTYASAHSRAGHVNCKDQREMKALIGRYFYNVLAFSMNDEVIHTGYHAMAHYILVVGCGKRAQSLPPAPRTTAPRDNGAA